MKDKENIFQFNYKFNLKILMSISRNSEEMHKQSTFFHENFIRIKLNELRDEKLIKDFKILVDCEDNFIIVETFC